MRLLIQVDARWLDHPNIQSLRDKGHEVIGIPEGSQGSDLILSTKAWNWSDHLWPFLELALKQVRKEKRLKDKVNEVKGGTDGGSDRKPARKNRKRAGKDQPADASI